MSKSVSLTDNILDRIKPYFKAPAAHRIFILYGSARSGKTKIVREIAHKLNGVCIDLLEDKLQFLSPKLGLYSPVDFKKGIGLWAKEANPLIIIDEIEALLDTWNQEERKNFLKLVSKWRTDSVVLIVTRLDDDYESIFGKDRVFRI